MKPTIYYASGGDYGDSLVLLLDAGDFACLRRRQAQARAIFAAHGDEAPDNVSWYFDGPAVVEWSQPDGVLAELFDDMGDSCVLDDGEATLFRDAEAVRTDMMTVSFSRYMENSASIEWYLKHGDQSYFVSLHITPEESP